MKIPFNDLKKRYESVRKEVQTAALRAMDSGWYILGQEVKTFEESFATWCGVDHAVGVANGTDALQLALMALGVASGDEVITVPNTAIPTVVAIKAVGAKPVYCDIDPDLYTMNPDTLAACITDKTKAIIPVHLFGHMAEMPRIMEIADAHSIPVIEDCAQSHGAAWQDQKCGTFGALGCFSFYPTKNLGALGDAGAIVTNDSELAEKLKRMRNYGQSARYKTQEFGLNSRLDEMQAAILSAQLPMLTEWTNRRREIADIYKRNLADTDLILPIEQQGTKHVYHLFVVRVENRTQLKEKLAEQGIGSDVHYPYVLYRQSAFEDANQEGSCPVAEHYHEQILSLPCYPELTDDQIMFVAEALKLHHDQVKKDVA